MNLKTNGDGRVPGTQEPELFLVRVRENPDKSQGEAVFCSHSSAGPPPAFSRILMQFSPDPIPRSTPSCSRTPPSTPLLQAAGSAKEVAASVHNLPRLCSPIHNHKSPPHAASALQPAILKPVLIPQPPPPVTAEVLELLSCRLLIRQGTPPHFIDTTEVAPAYPSLPLFTIRAPSGAEYAPLTAPGQLAGKGSFGAVMRYSCDALTASDVALGLPREVVVKTVFAGQADPAAPFRFNSGREDVEELMGADCSRGTEAARDGRVVAALVVLRATELAGAAGVRAPDAWSAVLMESADATLWDLRDTRPGGLGPAEPVRLTAAEVCTLVRETALAAQALLNDGLLHGDVKAANVLFSLPPDGAAGELRVYLGDLGGLSSTDGGCFPGRRPGKSLAHPPTFPLPGVRKDRQPREEAVAAWDCAALFLQLFQWRLVPGSRQTAWSGLGHNAVSTANLTSLVRALEKCSYGADGDAAAVRDAFLAVLPLDAATGRPQPGLMTLARVIDTLAPLCGGTERVARELRAPAQPPASPPRASPQRTSSLHSSEVAAAPPQSARTPPGSFGMETDDADLLLFGGMSPA